MNVGTKRALRAAIDVMALALAFLGAWVLRFEGNMTARIWQQALIMLPYVVATKYALMATFGGRRHSWRFIGLAEVLAVVRAMLVSSALLVLVRLGAHQAVAVAPAMEYGIVPFGVVGIDLALSMLGLVGMRTLRRMQFQRREMLALSRVPSAQNSRVLLIGAGRAGVTIARELEARPDLGKRAVAFVDTGSGSQGQTIHRLPVLGSTEDLPQIVQELEVDEAIITTDLDTEIDIRRILFLCERAELPVLIVPGLHEIVSGRVSLSRIRPIAIEDLLRREPVELDTSAIRHLVAHEVVLVTGAGGSIGAELCRQLGRFSPRELVLVERSEPALWSIHRELESSLPDVQVVPALGDVRDHERMDAVLLRHRPSSIFHAAAHKHVPLMEANPGEAVKNNILGTRVIADLAADRGVERFVMISTDKAVNPTSVMGATKRVAERYVQHLAETTGRTFVSVRFGNVLGSAGSVVPIFKEQIEAGGPVTVTDPEMRRYFMTIPEAAQLVLQAGAMGTGGEIFVLDMGDPVRIVDLAEDLIRLSGLVPGRDIDITFTGLRPGEKLFEELSLSEEAAQPTPHPKVWIGRHPAPVWGDVEDALEELASHVDRASPVSILESVLGLVPEYTPDARTAAPPPGESGTRPDEPRPLTWRRD